MSLEVDQGKLIFNTKGETLLLKVKNLGDVRLVFKASLNNSEVIVAPEVSFIAAGSTVECYVRRINGPAVTGEELLILAGPVPNDDVDYTAAANTMTAAPSQIISVPIEAFLFAKWYRRFKRYSCGGCNKYITFKERGSRCKRKNCYKFNKFR